MDRPFTYTGLAKATLLPALAVVAGLRYFHRAPARAVPQGADLVVSPADGRVIYVEHVVSDVVSFFKSDVLNVLQLNAIRPPYVVVVIELNLLNVHVQRAPIRGIVLAKQHFPGGHQNVLTTAGKERLVNSNEKALTVIGDGRRTVGVIQVAGLAARRIVSYVDVGQPIPAGGEIGLITFGSQVVLVLPGAAVVTVRPGEQVTDGESVIARL